MPESFSKKITLIQDYLRQLGEYLAECTEGTRPPDSTVFSIERLFQLVVDEAVDVNALILEREKRPLPDTNQATFEALADAGIISRDLHARIAGSVGLRNRLVHRYETVQRSVLLREVPTYTAAYTDYLAIVIKKYLS
ncbi:MAG: hypothetical protein UY50_C0022G0014 [Parcubacteria group bacterium GW2011_GWA2_49_9]|nr:MAG: hypothetical protein UY50_C0022G0014 [Parcubacteria group bacterium GW2011_GWA2_49_9]